MLIPENALHAVCDRASLFGFLRDHLQWPLAPEDTFVYQGPQLHGDVAARASVSQIVPFTTGDPFTILLVEFESGFRRTDLREILRRVREEIRKRAKYGGRKLEEIVFVCATENYGGIRFAHFETHSDGRQPKMRVFGWDCGQPDGMRTLRDYNLQCLQLPVNILEEPDWKAAKPLWQQAWNVERVTNEFFREYKDLFETVEAQIAGARGDRRLFTQRLFNRLMFVQFLSKKRPAWLRYAGRDDYLQALYDAEARDRDGTDFYADRLYWAFFYGLGTVADSREVHGMEELRQRRGDIPFLNGGLFDKERDGNDDAANSVTIPNKAFAAILALFRRYNFTITESAPDDADVAIDPEMLGKVFERLVTGRHESGSYYTPRGIVMFMCRESLKRYLEEALTPAPLPKKPGRGETGDAGSAASSEIGKDLTSGSSPFGSGENGIAEAIAAFVDRRDASGLPNPEAALLALRDVKVCDPACGSGAYLLGMMQELLGLRKALFASKALDFKQVYDRKKEIIQRNLYGADKDPFAVNIAMLRLWLSLVIEDRRDALHDNVDVSLPNLKFKIVTGDSLTAPDPSSLNLQADEYGKDAARLRWCHDEYFAAHDGGIGSTRRKDDVEKKVHEVEDSLTDLFGSEANPTNEDGSPRVVWHVAFAEVFAPRHAEADWGGSLNLGGTLAEPPRPGGFDIVLANPPYVRMELFKEAKPTLRRVYAHVHAERADLYTYFYARAVQLLTPGGVLAFISPNKWFRAGYGAHLRKYIAEHCRVRSITDFGDLPVFENATTYPMVFVAQKGKGVGLTHFTLVKSLNPPYPDVRALVQRDGSELPTDAIRGAEWALTDKVSADRLRKMERAGLSLERYVNGQIYRGIASGLNTAFIISSQQRAELISMSPSSSHIIKRVVGGENVRRWTIPERNRWLLYMNHGVDTSNLDAIVAHLSPYKQQLESRATRQEWYELQQPQFRFVPSFEKPKIVFPDIAKEARFAFDTTGAYLSNTAYAIPVNDMYLLGVLNSKSVEEFYLEISAQVRGGYLRFIRQYVEKIPIPNANDSERTAIAALVQKCLDAKGVDCGAWEAEINGRVAALYGL